MANIELLDKIITKIEENPEQWNQKYWISADVANPETGESCGTAYCVAGWAVTLAGATPVWNRFSSMKTTAINATTGFCTFDAGRIRGVEDYAMELLDLPEEDAHELFHADNTLDDIKRIRDELVANSS
jgi:hypothetical protein